MSREYTTEDLQTMVEGGYVKAVIVDASWLFRLLQRVDESAVEVTEAHLQNKELKKALDNANNLLDQKYAIDAEQFMDRAEETIKRLASDLANDIYYDAILNAPAQACEE